MADAHEAFGDDVKHETPDEFDVIEFHAFDFCVIGIVFVAEDDGVVIGGIDAMIGDGDAVGVVAEVFDHGFGAAEGLLDIDGPVFFVEGFEDGGDSEVRRHGDFAGAEDLP